MRNKMFSTKSLLYLKFSFGIYAQKFRVAMKDFRSEINEFFWYGAAYSLRKNLLLAKLLSKTPIVDVPMDVILPRKPHV